MKEYHHVLPSTKFEFSLKPLAYWAHTECRNLVTPSSDVSNMFLQLVHLFARFFVPFAEVLYSEVFNITGKETKGHPSHIWGEAE